jgi:hypothetical protein
MRGSYVDCFHCRCGTLWLVRERGVGEGYLCLIEWNWCGVDRTGSETCRVANWNFIASDVTVVMNNLLQTIRKEMISHVSSEPTEGKDTLQQGQSLSRPRIELLTFLIDVSIVTGRASLFGPSPEICVSVAENLGWLQVYLYFCTILRDFHFYREATNRFWTQQATDNCCGLLASKARGQDIWYSASHSRVAPENVGLQKEQKCNFICMSYL